MSFIRPNEYNYKVDCHYLVRAHHLVLIVFVYFMKLQMKFRDSASFHGFRFKSAIPRIPRVFRDRGKSLALSMTSVPVAVPLITSVMYLPVCNVTVRTDQGQIKDSPQIRPDSIHRT